jgi:2,3-bisphosphoglycerate-independent phosphoglycerate mutase
MTSHTKNPVPLSIINGGKLQLRNDGSLCDIAPTILEIMNIKKPIEMTGASLIKE